MSKTEKDGEVLWFSSLVKQGMIVFITRPVMWVQSFVMACISVLLFPLCWWILPGFMALKRIGCVKSLVGMSLRLRWLFMSEFPVMTALFSGFVIIYCHLWETELQETFDGSAASATTVFRFRILNWLGLSFLYLVMVLNTLIFYISVKVPSLKVFHAVTVSVKQLVFNCVQLVLLVLLLSGAIVLFEANLPAIISFFIRFLQTYAPQIKDLNVTLSSATVLAVGIVYYMGAAVWVLRLVSRRMFMELLENIKGGKISVKGGF